MHFDEFRLALTHAAASARCTGQDLAILWDRDTIENMQSSPKVKAVDTSLATPIVRLLRNRGERLAKGYFMTSTSVPTEACLGMARMCGVNYILYVEGGAIRKVTCRRNGTTVETVTAGFAGPIANVTKQQGRNWLNVAWHSAPDTNAAHLKSWLEYVSGERGAAGGMASAARTTAITSTGAPVSSFASSGLEYLGLKAMIGDQTVVDNIMMMLAFEMVSQVSGFSTSRGGTVTATPGQRSAPYSGQNIGSLLSDSEGNILGWGFNTNKDNSTRHGEVNLISHFLVDNPGETLPDGGTIYTTLEPCEMCSGFISRAVRQGYTFRVIYGQKDDNVFSTALQRNANPGITMSGSQALMASKAQIKTGTAVGATRSLVGSISRSQSDSGIIATTQFLKEKSTYEAFFGVARPQWWLYMWDYMTSKFIGRDNSAKSDTLLKDPAVMKVNNDLDIVYQLVESFMQTVKRQGATG